MLEIAGEEFWTRRLLREQIAALGVAPGDAVMVHAALRAVGPMLNGPDTLIDAVLDAVGPQGTLLCYVNWAEEYEDALDDAGRVPPALKDEIPPFDPARSRASRDHGALAEFLRTVPGAQRSGNPGASVAALGARAGWFCAEHALDYGYGPASPFARLVEAGGKVLMAGAPLDTMSLLHHAEHLARIPGKRVRRMEVPLLAADGRSAWRMIEEFDTVDPVCDGLEEDYFATVVEDFLSTGQGRRGQIGLADGVLVSAPAMLDFAVDWLERRFN